MAADPAARIIEAADALFCEQGYDGVSMRDVARRAGVNKASVFYYFNSKDELFEKVLELYYEAHQKALSSAFETGGTIAERLHRVVDGYIDFMAENSRYPKLVQGILLSGKHEIPLIKSGLGNLFAWTSQILEGVAPTAGPRSSRQLFVTIAGSVMNYFIYAPALAESWGDDPESREMIAERREHLHWLVDRILADLPDLR
jgi:TetR/AcrR family transcriptional regulator